MFDGAWDFMNWFYLALIRLERIFDFMGIYDLRYSEVVVMVSHVIRAVAEGFIGQVRAII